MKKTIFAVIGSLLLITTGIAYVPKFSIQGLQGIELTFLANFFTGLLLLWDGWLQMRKRSQVKQEYHLAMDGILMCVLLICIFCFREATFSGPFLFLHIINPLIVTVVVIVFTYQGPINLCKMLLSTGIPALLYFVYVVLYGYRSGEWLYSVINVQEKGVIYVAVFCVTSSIIIFGMECLVYKASKIIGGRLEGGSATEPSPGPQKKGYIS